MITKTGQPGASGPRDSVEPTPYVAKDDVKASATSGTDEPTNSSSAGSLQPPNKSEKATKGLSEAASKPEGGRLTEASPPAPLIGDLASDCNKQASVAAMTTSEPKPLASIAELRRLARQPGSRLNSGTLDNISSLVDLHKNKAFISQNSYQILGKRLRKKDSGDSYRELLDQTESLEEHYGHRVQTPQIFEKTLQLPPRLPGQAAQVSSVAPVAPTNTARVPDANQHTVPSAGGQTVAAPVSVKALEKQTAAGAAAKRPLLPPRDDVSLMDYDFGLCSNQIELQKNQSKCFENMLDLINLTYFGSQQSNALQPSSLPRLDVPNIAGLATAGNGAQPNRRDTTTGTTQLPKQSMDAPSSSTLQQLGLGTATTVRAQQAGSGGTFTAPAANEGQKRMKLSQLDFLANPLRSDHPFEIWSAKEMALFSACICQFGKRFDLFVPLIKTKTGQEIYEFYRCWKYTKYYRTWKLKAKDRPKSNMASLNELVYHDRQI